MGDVESPRYEGSSAIAFGRLSHHYCWCRARRTVDLLRAPHPLADSDGRHGESVRNSRRLKRELDTPHADSNRPEIEPRILEPPISYSGSVGNQYADPPRQRINEDTCTKVIAFVSVERAL